MPDDFFSGGSATTPLDVRAFFDSSVTGLVSELMDLGCLVSMGTTRDRGALGITVTRGGQWRREYFRRADDAGDWLGDAVRKIAAMGPLDDSQNGNQRQRAPRGR